jgi:TonB family protein
MSRFQTRRSAALCTLLSAALIGSAAAQAPAAPAAPDLSPADRAKRDAEKVFQWIRIHSDKPRKSAATPAAPADKAPATAGARPAPRRAPEDGAGDTARQAAGATARQDAAAQPVKVPAEPPLAAAAAAPAPATNTSATAAVDASAPLLAPPPQEDVILTPVVKTDPEFPASLMRQLRKGLVQVGFTVTPDGSVTQVHAVSSSHPRLVAAALSTVAQWRFKPTRKPQQAVVDLGFNLD